VEIEGEFTTEDTENTEERFRQNRSGAEKDCGRQPEATVFSRELSSWGERVLFEE